MFLIARVDEIGHEPLADLWAAIDTWWRILQWRGTKGLSDADISGVEAVGKEFV